MKKRRTNPLAELTEQDRARFTTLAEGLKSDGYNGAVTCRKMITIHGMEEDAAVQLVSGVYGKRVNPRVGDTTFTVIVSLVGMVLFFLIGLVILPAAIINVWVLKASLVLFGIAGAALVRALMAVINKDAKDDLRQRRR